MMYIKNGRVPDTDKFEKHVLSPTQKLVADRVTDDLEDKALEYLEKAQLKDLTSRHAIDEQRRLHLASQGLSRYTQIVLL